MSSRYFENKDCEYYPCHKTDRLNCLFCYCPLYFIEDCGGTPRYISSADGRKIKDCTCCIFPHIEENYDKVIEKLKNINQGR